MILQHYGTCTLLPLPHKNAVFVHTSPTKHLFCTVSPRRLYVLGQLSTLVYDIHTCDVGTTTVYTLPLAHRTAPGGATVAGGGNNAVDESVTSTQVSATLMHVRYVVVDVGTGDVWTT